LSPYRCRLDPSPTPLPTLSLHDALPISIPRPPAGRWPTTSSRPWRRRPRTLFTLTRQLTDEVQGNAAAAGRIGMKDRPISKGSRSEEHTSELQSRFDLVCRLLLEKKNRR